MSPDLLGSEASAWLRLGSQVPAGCVRLVLSDVDGVITRGEGQPADLAVIARLAAWNRAALADARVPAVTLCTGRQAPYVELMAQMTEVFLPCIFEHGAGLFFPRSFLYQFDPLLGPGMPPVWPASVRRSGPACWTRAVHSSSPARKPR